MEGWITLWLSYFFSVGSLSVLLTTLLTRLQRRRSNATQRYATAASNGCPGGGRCTGYLVPFTIPPWRSSVQ